VRGIKEELNGIKGVSDDYSELAKKYVADPFDCYGVRALRHKWLEMALDGGDLVK